MAKVDRSILTSNDQSIGQFGDPDKLESSITHLADKIDENDNGFIAHKDAAVLAHPDKSVTEAKLADLSVSRRTIVKGAVSREELDPTLFEQTANAAKFQEIDAELAQKTNQIESTQLNLKYPPPPLVGLVGDGTDETTIFNNLRVYAIANNISKLFLPEGIYKGEFTLTEDGISLYGAGRESTTLMPVNVDKYVVRLCADRSEVKGLTIDGGGVSGAIGLGIVPMDETQTTTLVNTNHNLVEEVRIVNCLEGVILRNGPEVNGMHSGCWYNTLNIVDIEDCDRAIWLRDGTNVGSSPANRNKFNVVRINSANVGIQIDAGDTNTFTQCALNGVADVGRRATPTAILINYRGITGYDNAFNRFSLCTFEGNTVDLENNAIRTELYGCNIGNGKLKGTMNPAIIIGSYAGGQPLILPGLQYSEANALTGIKNGVWNFEKPINDIGFDWKSYTLDVANMVNITALSTQKESEYMVLSSMVEWHMRVNFQASVSTDPIKVLLPVEPKTSLYKTYSSVAPLRIPVSVHNGSSEQITIAQFEPSTNYLKILAPTNGWNTTGAYNALNLTLRYRKA